MKKVNLIYHAPKGDAKTTDMHGTVLVDGKATDVIVNDDRVEKLKNNPVFEVVSVSDVDEAPKATPEPPDEKPHGAAKHDPPTHQTRK